MANWTPEGFVGKTFRAMAEHVPPPPGIPAPILWGKEDVVRERFGGGISALRAERRPARFEYPFPPERVVEFFREYFGPTKTAFSKLDAEGQERLSKVLASLWREHNESPNGETVVSAEYLEVHAVRA
jgi:hypothetical protein